MKLRTCIRILKVEKFVKSVISGKTGFLSVFPHLFRCLARGTTNLKIHWERKVPGSHSSDVFLPHLTKDTLTITYTHTRTHICTHTCPPLYRPHTHTHTHTHTHSHSHACTHMHTYAHTCCPPLKPLTRSHHSNLC